MRINSGGVWFWRVVLLGLCALTLIPLSGLLQWDGVDRTVWAHLWAYQVPSLLRNTTVLLFGVGFGVLLLGISCAWLVSFYEFPLRGVLRWLLMLPMAMPAYVLAFALLGVFDYSGGVQTYLRTHGVDASAWLDLRSDWGVVLVLSLALYPYVYLLAQEGFAHLGVRVQEVGQSLGLSPWQSFWRVVLPSTRPWWMGGLGLALMETLADFGTVSTLGFDTFTTAIYKAWFALFSFQSAQQLASLMIVLVFALLWLELRARGHRRYQALGRTAPIVRQKLSFWGQVGVSVWLWGILSLACFVPVAQLLVWVGAQTQLNWARVGSLLGQSLLLGVLAALVVVLLASMLAYARRYAHLRGQSVLVQIATLGYAVPGAILAVAFFTPMAFLDRMLLNLGWLDAGDVLFRGSLVALLLAYATRFLAVAHASVESGLQRMGRHHEEVAQSLGVAGFALWRRVHWPLLYSSLLTAGLMVAVDVMKEMPMTLMARPTGWDTLATQIFAYTSEGDWHNAALPSLLLVLIGLIPVGLLAWQMRRRF